MSTIGRQGQDSRRKISKAQYALRADVRPLHGLAFCIDRNQNDLRADTEHRPHLAATLVGGTPVFLDAALSLQNQHALFGSSGHTDRVEH